MRGYIRTLEEQPTGLRLPCVRSPACVGFMPAARSACVRNGVRKDGREIKPGRAHLQQVVVGELCLVWVAVEECDQDLDTG